MNSSIRSFFNNIIIISFFINQEPIISSCIQSLFPTKARQFKMVPTLRLNSLVSEEGDSKSISHLAVSQLLIFFFRENHH